MKPAYNIVYLIGFMGSGKTTAGNKLASLLGYKFADIDNLVEEKAGKTISEIFAKQGEDYFRNLESDMLRSLKSDENIIVSTGGGAPCYKDNMEYMNQTGLTVYLKLNPGQLKSRLINSKGQRPLLKDLDDEELLDFIVLKLAERHGWYEKSKLIVDGFDIDIQNIAKLIRDF